MILCTIYTSYRQNHLNSLPDLLETALSLDFLPCLSASYLLLSSTVRLSPCHIWNQCRLHSDKPALTNICELHMCKWKTFFNCSSFCLHWKQRTRDLGSSPDVVSLHMWIQPDFHIANNFFPWTNSIYRIMFFPGGKKAGTQTQKSNVSVLQHKTRGLVGNRNY